MSQFSLVCGRRVRGQPKPFLSRFRNSKRCIDKTRRLGYSAIIHPVWTWRFKMKEEVMPFLNERERKIFCHNVDTVPAPGQWPNPMLWPLLHLPFGEEGDSMRDSACRYLDISRADLFHLTRDVGVHRGRIHSLLNKQNAGLGFRCISCQVENVLPEVVVAMLEAKKGQSDIVQKL